MKTPVISSELWSAYDAYLAAKKISDETHALIIPKLDAIVKGLQFKKSVRTGSGRLLEEGLIEKEDDMYQASKEDQKIYYAKAGELYKSLGYELPEGHSPVLIAERQMRDAKRDLIEKSLYLVADTGITLQDLLRNIVRYKQYFEKILKVLTLAKKERQAN